MEVKLSWLNNYATPYNKAASEPTCPKLQQIPQPSPQLKLPLLPLVLLRTYFDDPVSELNCDFTTCTLSSAIIGNSSISSTYYIDHDPLLPSQ